MVDVFEAETSNRRMLRGGRHRIFRQLRQAGGLRQESEDEDLFAGELWEIERDARSDCLQQGVKPCPESAARTMCGKAVSVARARCGTRDVPSSPFNIRAFPTQVAVWPCRRDRGARDSGPRFCVTSKGTRGWRAWGTRDA